MYIKTLIVICSFLTIGVFNVHANFGDVNVTRQTASPTTFSTATSTTPFELSCVPGQMLETFGFYTRSFSGTRNLGLSIDGVAKSTTTITTTPAYASYTDVDTLCLDGSWDVKFTPSASTFYVYGTQGDTQGDYVLLYTGTGATYGARYTATFSLPLTVSTSTNMGSATTTVLTQNDALLSFALLYFVFVLTIVLFVGVLYPIYARK